MKPPEDYVVRSTRPSNVRHALAAALMTFVVAACGGDSEQPIWVSTTIASQNCGDDGRSARRVLNSKLVSSGTPESCYVPSFFNERDIVNYLRDQEIVPMETQCGVIQVGPPIGASPFGPHRAYHFKVTSLQGRAMVESGRFTTKTFYDETEYFFELSCDVFGLVPKP